MKLKGMRNMKRFLQFAFIFAIGLMIPLILAPCIIAGTFRDDFENEKDFLSDNKFREGGVWGEDIKFYKWEKGTIRGIPKPAMMVFLITGDYGWKDYIVECKAKLIKDDCVVGLVLRHSCIDCNLGYAFCLEGNFFGGNQASIVPLWIPLWTPLRSVGFTASKDVWYTLKAVAQGERFEFYIDNKLFVEAEDFKDSPCPAGKAGFLFSGFGLVEEGEALFDDFVMTGPEVKDGGHWDPKAHLQSKSVSLFDKLATSWGDIKLNR